MHLYRIEERQTVPADLPNAWDFFSNPANLARITPPDMGFEVTVSPPERIYPGLIISYRVRPLLGIPVEWVTEITHIDAPHYFVDVQRGGPYAFWHHEHQFRAVPGGTEVHDRVSYALPFDPLSRPLHDHLIHPRLRTIFEYRRRALEHIFGPPPPARTTNLEPPTNDAGE